MTRATLLAIAAAVLAAAALVELAGAARRPRTPRRPAWRVSAVLAAAGARLGLPAAPDDLARRLAGAGMPPRITVAEVVAVKWAAVVVGGLVALPLAPVLPGRLGLVAVVAAPAAAFLAPDAWLARRTRRRRDAIAAELADVLDLLHVASAAGLSPLRSLGEVGRRRGGVLAGELATAAARAALGVPHATALRDLTRRCPHEAVTALVAAIGRTERHGAPLGPALHALAADARARQAQRTRERAARAAPKIQLVVALLLVPAVMLLVGASLVAALL